MQGEVIVPIGKVDYPGVRGGLFAANPTSGKPALSCLQVIRRDIEQGQTVVEVEIFTGGRLAQPNKEVTLPAAARSGVGC